LNARDEMSVDATGKLDRYYKLKNPRAKRNWSSQLWLEVDFPTFTVKYKILGIIGNPCKHKLVIGVVTEKATVTHLAFAQSWHV